MRLARRAGVQRLSSLTNDEIRGRTRQMLDDWISKIVTYTEHNRKQTVGLSEAVAGIPHKYYSKNLIEKGCKIKRSKAESEIKHYQNLSGCLSIRKQPFERLVREVAQEYKIDLRFSADAILIIQHCLENCLVEMLSAANLSAIHAKRNTVFPKDLQLQKNMFERNNHCGNGSMSAGSPLVNYHMYIKMILKELKPTKKISKNALYQINQLLNLLAKAICEKAHFLNSKEIKSRVKKTISAREIQSSIRLILSGQLVRQAVSTATGSVVKFANAAKSEGRTSLQAKAGLKFPVTRTSRFFKKYNTRVGDSASVYLASVLEYITAEILDISSNKDGILSSRALKLALDNDDDLKSLCKALCFDIADGGVVPFFIPFRRKRVVEEEAEEGGEEEY
jgi:histone H3/H4